MESYTDHTHHRLEKMLMLSLFLLACQTEPAPPANLPTDPPVEEPPTEEEGYTPSVDVSWQWQLTGNVNTTYNVELYDIDLFDNSEEQIKALQDDGRRVICYFSAGSSEDWRSDFNQFDDATMGKKLDGWAGERWLDIRAQNVVNIMVSRLDLAVSKGCDGVEPDNVDGFSNNTGFDLTYEDQLAFNKHIANEAHLRGLSIGLKNDGDQVVDLVSFYDFSLNEQCHEYNECAQLFPFLNDGKPILNVEYPESKTATELEQAVCPKAINAGLRTLILPWDLNDDFRISCDGE